MRDSRVLVLLGFTGLVALGLLLWFPEQARTQLLATPAVDPGEFIPPAHPQTSPGIPVEDPGDRKPEEPRGTEQGGTHQRFEVPTNALFGRLLQSDAPLPHVRVELLGLEKTPPRRYQQVRETRTDAEGRFVFRGLETTTHELRMEGPGVPRQFKVEGIPMSTDRQADLGDLDVPVPASLAGRLVDGDGRSVAGISVFHSQDFSTRLRRSREDPGEQVVRAVSDYEGRFRFDNALPGDHNILVESREYADLQARAKLEPGAHHDFGDLVMQRGRQLQGRVVSADGTSVVGALVAPEDDRFDRPVVRKGTRTDVGGRFNLRGIGKNVGSIVVQADGFQELHLPKKEWREPLFLQLLDLLVLSGRVEGHEGKETHITLEAAYDSGRRPPNWVYDLLDKPLPVNKDGTFRVEGLAEGAFEVHAETEGLGTSVKLVVRVEPDMEPVVLKIIPHTRIAVLLRDDLGRPIEDAEVVVDPGIAEYPSTYTRTDAARTRRILTSYRKRVLEPTDRVGRTELLQDQTKPLALGANHPDHVSSSVVFAGGAWPDPVEIVLQRAARITGRLTDPTGQDQYGMSVSITRAGIDPSIAKASPIFVASRNAKAGKSWGARINAKGHFDVGQLPPGSYDVVVSRWNSTTRNDRRRLLRATPLLGAGTDQRTAQRVALHPGETTDVVLEVASLGRIEGRVYLAGRPAAGVIVFAINANNGPKNRLFPLPLTPDGKPDWDQEDAHSFQPFTTTKQDGSFLFLYATPGTWEFRARHPDAPVPAPPVLVQATAHGMSLHQDLHLGPGTVRGEVDMNSFAEEQRKWLSAYLFRLDRAHIDSFYSAYHGRPQSSGMKAVELGADGHFEFPYVPEGDWVLRIVGRNIAIQEPVTTRRNLVTDLGRLQAPKTVDLEVEVILPDPQQAAYSRWGSSFGVWIRRPVPGRKLGIFVRAVHTTDRLQVNGLEPGTYVLELFSSYPSFITRGISGKSLSRFRTLVVHPDGTTEPERLSFR